METASDRVFMEVVSEILTGSLRPRDQLSERDLVARYGVSRTPVREALKRLLERGFLEIGPKGVAQVLDINMEDLEKLYDLRLLLESKAATATVENLTTDEIEELRRINGKFAKAVDGRNLEDMLDVRAQFHALLVRGARNRWLAEVLVSLREKAYVVRYTHWQTIERAQETFEMHEQIIRALKRRDLQRYRRLVISQISAGWDLYKQQLRPKDKRSAIRKTGS
jgi:DNA-binding GntR family transcriptional regulator